MKNGKPMSKTLSTKDYKKRLHKVFFYGFFLALCLVCAVEDYIGGSAGVQGYCAWALHHWVPWQHGIWVYAPTGIFVSVMYLRMRRT